MVGSGACGWVMVDDDGWWGFAFGPVAGGGWQGCMWLAGPNGGWWW